MKASILASVLICVYAAAYAQSGQNSVAPKASAADMHLLETKIRQAWEDYKNKNKEAFARIFTSDAIEAEEGADGPHDLKATLAEMDEFSMRNYSVRDFITARSGPMACWYATTWITLQRYVAKQSMTNQ